MANKQITGHYWNKKSVYTKKDVYELKTWTGGAAQVAESLGMPFDLPIDMRIAHILHEDRRFLGWEPGSEYIMPPAPEASHTLVWDEDFGGLILPESGKVMWASDKALPPKNVVKEAANRLTIVISADLLRKKGAHITKANSWERTVADLVYELTYNAKVAYLTKAAQLFILFGFDGAALFTADERVLTLCGSDTEGEKEVTYYKWGDKIAELTRQFFNDELLSVEGKCYRIPKKNVEEWEIAACIEGQSLYKMAREYVLTGKLPVNIPKLTIGKLTTFDRWEIEAFGNIKKLLDDYQHSDINKPLNIAVFGAPGSGKSFGVKQIAEKLLKKNTATIEINISQLREQSELIQYYHKIRDLVLEGKLPIVFFDEFDSERDGKKLGWLKSFLMPMQDGAFLDSSGVHPIGKCVFVFAGGTKNNFAEFDAQKNEALDAKAPDFISRLRGTLNILGPNPKPDSKEQSFLLRRAILIRSHLAGTKVVESTGKDEQGKEIRGGRARIQQEVLHALLTVPIYKNGARSVENLLKMSRLDSEYLTSTMLPSEPQIDLCCDASIFMSSIRRETNKNRHRDVLAKAIHEDFRKNNPGSKTDMPWEELSEHFRDSNREQADSYGEYLERVDCFYDTTDELYFDKVTEFSNEEIEKIAKKCHEVYVDGKIKAGYRWGPERDDNANPPTNPTLLSWWKLPEDEKEKDRVIARNIIPLLNGVGIKVYREYSNNLLFTNDAAEIIEKNIDKLARQIHEDYLMEMSAAGNTGHPGVVEWEELSEEFKESNRAQARSIGEKLSSVGLAFDAGESSAAAVEEFDDETILFLAENEHIRWMQEKLANGWVYAPVRDNEKKHHSWLVPYEQLPPEERQKDINVVKNIIPLLKSIGLRVYRVL